MFTQTGTDKPNIVSNNLINICFFTNVILFTGQLPVNYMFYFTGLDGPGKQPYVVLRPNKNSIHQEFCTTWNIHVHVHASLGSYILIESCENTRITCINQNDRDICKI